MITLPLQLEPRGHTSEAVFISCYQTLNQTDFAYGPKDAKSRAYGRVGLKTNRRAFEACQHTKTWWGRIRTVAGT